MSEQNNGGGYHRFVSREQSGRPVTSEDREVHTGRLAGR